MIFIANESKTIIFYRCNLFNIIFYFVTIHERPAMGSQQNLASWSEVVSIYKCPPKFRGPLPQNLRRKTSILDQFFRDFRNRHRGKNARVNLQCVPYKLTYFL